MPMMSKKIRLDNQLTRHDGKYTGDPIKKRIDKNIKNKKRKTKKNDACSFLVTEEKEAADQGDGSHRAPTTQFNPVAVAVVNLLSHCSWFDTVTHHVDQLSIDKSLPSMSITNSTRLYFSFSLFDGGNKNREKQQQH